MIGQRTGLGWKDHLGIFLIWAISGLVGIWAGFHAEVFWEGVVVWALLGSLAAVLGTGAILSVIDVVLARFLERD